MGFLKLIFLSAVSFQATFRSLFWPWETTKILLVQNNVDLDRFVERYIEILAAAELTEKKWGPDSNIYCFETEGKRYYFFNGDVSNVSDDTANANVKLFYNFDEGTGHRIAGNGTKVTLKFGKLQ